MTAATRDSWKFIGYTWLGLAAGLLLAVCFPGAWLPMYPWVLVYGGVIGLFVVAAGIRLIQREGAAPFIFSAALMWFGPQLAVLLTDWFRRIMP